MLKALFHRLRMVIIDTFIHRLLFVVQSNNEASVELSNVQDSNQQQMNLTLGLIFMFLLLFNFFDLL